MTPTMGKCNSCQKPIQSREFMSCMKCNLRYDLVCASVPYKRFRTMTSEIKQNWSCSTCRVKEQGVQERILDTPKIVPSKLNEHSEDVEGNVTYRRKSKMVDNLVCDQNKGIPITMDNDIISNNVMINIVDIIKKEVTAAMKSSIKELVSQQLVDIKEYVSGFQDSLSFFNAKYEEMKKELEEKSNIIQRLQTDNEKLTGAVTELSNRLNTAEQYLRECNVEINNIPEQKSEILSTTLLQLAKTVECTLHDDDIINITRVAKLDKENKKPRTIVAKLRSPRLRDTLLAAVTKFNRTHHNDKLSSKHLGYAAPHGPVFVSEHLTPSTKSLHAAARKKAKEQSYTFTWVRNSRIFVRKNEHSQKIHIRNSKCLDLII